MTRDLEPEFRDLWRRRASLTREEWGRLYEISRAVLVNLWFPSIGNRLPRSDKEDYFHGCWEHKIFRLDAPESSEYGFAGLKTIYLNYLKDEAGKECRGRGGNEIHIEDILGEDANFDDLNSEAMVQGSTIPLDLWIQYDLDRSAVAASAQAWLVEQEPWVLIMLSRAVAPDNEDHVPLYLLRRDAGIPNYHNRAKKLGISWDYGQALATGNSYESTLIGQWLVSLGVRIQDENTEILHEALKILLHVSLGLQVIR